MTERVAVEVSDLAVRFRQRERTIHAVNGVSFRLARGEVLGILGESGCGKSVTLRALMRLLPANCEIEGRVVINGEDVTAAPAARLEELRGGAVAMIFQEPATALDPGIYDWRADHRDDPAPPRHQPPRGASAGTRTARAGADPLGPPPARFIPTRDVGWHAPACDDRAGAVM
jgi:ABC-type oligopeptide transport system ATPase subunit